jgi:hypothetical protein
VDDTASRAVLEAFELEQVDYAVPDGAFKLDVLTRLGEVFTFDDIESERVAFEGLTVSVANARTLYRMKRDTVGLKDRADAALLRERLRLDEES